MGMSEIGEMESLHIIWDRNILSSFIPKAKLLNSTSRWDCKKLQLDTHCLAFNPGNHTLGQGHTFRSTTTTFHWGCNIFIQKQTYFNSLPSTPSPKGLQEQTYIQTWASWASSPCGHRHHAEGKWTDRPSRCPCQCCLGSWGITQHHNAKNSACFCSSNTGLKNP